MPAMRSACVGEKLLSGSAIPVGNAEHVAAPANANVPGPQTAQPVALMEPGFETVPAYPGAQIVQSVAEALPGASPVVVMPVGQRVHVPALAELANEPGAQAAQRVDAVPAKVPAAQAAQVAAPAAAENEPGAHGTQPVASAVPGNETTPE